MRRDIETRFKPKPDSFSRVPLSAYVDKRTDALVRALPDRSAWLRRVITEAAKRELMGGEDAE
jgi:hypothetical protein